MKNLTDEQVMEACKIIELKRKVKAIAEKLIDRPSTSVTICGIEFTGDDAAWIKEQMIMRKMKQHREMNNHNFQYYDIGEFIDEGA